MDLVLTEAQLMPGELEKKQMILSLGEMRRDSFFFDITFLCQGVTFRAHRVVVSSWSRWLRALLCEREDHVISLDLFSPDSFGCILDYMYGFPLTLMIQNVESIIKTVRRLEMQGLEKQCWRYLMTILDKETNCQALHELADRYDCPTLKLAAWRLMKSTNPTYSFSPAKILLERIQGKSTLKFLDHGFTGPEEEDFRGHKQTIGRFNIKQSKHGHREQEERDDNSNRGEVDDGDDASNDNSNHNDYESMANKLPSLFDLIENNDNNYNNAEHFTTSNDNNKNKPSTATEVVKTWANRLKNVYETCFEGTNEHVYDDQYDDDNLKKLSENGSTSRLYKRKNRHATNKSVGNNKSHNKKKEKDFSDDDDDDEISFRKKKKNSKHKTLESNNKNKNNRNQHKLYGTHEEFSSDDDEKKLVSKNKKKKLKKNKNNDDNDDNSSSSTTSTTATNEKKKKKNNNHWKLFKNSLLFSKMHLSTTTTTNKHRHDHDEYNNKKSSIIDWHVELKRFYLGVKTPEKIPGIKKILETWKGKEEDMLLTLIQKYEDAIPSSLMSHLEKLLNQLESKTDSSFVVLKKK